jgi:hypothetical protein
MSLATVSERQEVVRLHAIRLCLDVLPTIPFRDLKPDGIPFLVRSPEAVSALDMADHLIDCTVPPAAAKTADPL